MDIKWWPEGKERVKCKGARGFVAIRHMYCVGEEQMCVWGARGTGEQGCVCEGGGCRCVCVGGGGGKQVCVGGRENGAGGGGGGCRESRCRGLKKEQVWVIGESAGMWGWGKCRCGWLGKVQVWGIGKNAGVGDWGKCKIGGKCRCVGLGRVQVWGGWEKCR